MAPRHIWKDELEQQRILGMDSFKILQITVDLSNNTLLCLAAGDVVDELPHVVAARHRCTALKAKESKIKP